MEKSRNRCEDQYPKSNGIHPLPDPQTRGFAGGPHTNLLFLPPTSLNYNPILYAGTARCNTFGLSRESNLIIIQAISPTPAKMI